MKRVLVTGSNGFIGSRLVEELTKQGYDLTVTSRKNKRLSLKSDHSQILCDLSSIKNHFGHFDVVVNCASAITGKKSWDYFSKNNCSSVQNLIQQVDCDKFIHISSCSIFSENSYYHTQPSPYDYYGLSKYVSEKILEFYSKNFISSFIIRFPIVLGYGKNSNDVIQYIYDKAEQNEEIELFGKGQYYRNIIHLKKNLFSCIWSALSWTRAWAGHGKCMGHALPMPCLYPAHALPMPGPCPALALPIPCPCPTHALSIPCPCPAHVLTM